MLPDLFKLLIPSIVSLADIEEQADSDWAFQDSIALFVPAFGGRDLPLGMSGCGLYVNCSSSLFCWRVRRASLIWDASCIDGVDTRVRFQSFRSCTWYWHARQSYHTSSPFPTPLTIASSRSSGEHSSTFWLHVGSHTGALFPNATVRDWTSPPMLALAFKRSAVVMLCWSKTFRLCSAWTVWSR